MADKHLTHGEQLAVIVEIVKRVEKRQEDAADQREAMDERLRRIEERQADELRRMDAVEPIAQMVSSWRARAAGAVMLAGFIGTLMGLGWVLLKERAWDVWKAIIGG